MNTKDYKVIELKIDELITTNGGSDLTRAIFRAFGRIFGHVSAADAAESPGAGMPDGCCYNEDYEYVDCN